MCKSNKKSVESEVFGVFFGDLDKNIYFCAQFINNLKRILPIETTSTQF